MSLEELLDESNGKGFPVVTLTKRINMKRTRKASLIWDQLHKYKRTVHLAPLESGPNSLEKREKEFEGDPERASLTIQFSLKTDDLSRTQIERFARNLPLACRDSDVQVRRIDWIKIETLQPMSFQAVVKAVMKGRRKSTDNIRGSSIAGQPKRGLTRKRQQTNELFPTAPSKRRVSDLTSRPSSLTPVSPKSLTESLW